MAEVENLSIVIDIVDSYSKELDQLLVKLGQVETALQTVDDHTIDVDVRDGQVDALMAKLGAIGAMDLIDGGGVTRGGGGAVGGGGGGARAVANAAEEMGDEFKLTSLRMSDVHNALARLIPFLAVIIGALPAVIGGLVALAGAAVAAAGALATLGAFAAMGAALSRGGDMMTGFQEMFEEIQSDFMDAFRPLMERLAPLFEDALDGLDRLFQDIANQGDAFMMLRDQARAFGGWVLDVLPSLLADISMFVDAASKALGEVVEALGNIDVFGMLAGILADTLPLMMRMGVLLAVLLGHLYEMSLGFMRVANAVLLFTDLVLRVITLGGYLNEELGFMAAVVLTVWGATMLLNSSLLALAWNALVDATIAILGAVQAYTSYNVAALLAEWATWKLYAAVIALGSALSFGILGLIGILGGIGGAAASASNSIDEATSSLRAFEQQRNRMDRRGANPYANPEVERGQATGRSRFAGNSVNVTVEGDADADTVRQQSHNAMYRMNRTTE